MAGQLSLREGGIVSHLESVEARLAPAAVLEFSDDLRQPDVAPLRAFLDARLGELVAVAEDGSAARFTAERLRDLTSKDCVHLDDMLLDWQARVRAGLTEQSGSTQELRHDVHIWWNRLTTTAARFADHDDFNPRWRPLSWLCVEHAEFVEQAAGDATAGGTYGDGAHP